MRRAQGIAIVGAGAIGQALAADLARGGQAPACLVERPGAHAQALAEAGRIRVTGHLGSFACPLPPLHLDAAAAAEQRVIVVATTVDRHAEVARAMAAALDDDHVVLLANGYVGGSARFLASLEAAGCRATPSVLELNTTPYLVCCPAAGHIHVAARKTWMELSAADPALARAHHALLAGIVPGIEPAENALASALNNQNPVAHVPSYVLNAAEARHCRPVAPDAMRGGAFYLEDFSGPEVLSLRAAVDAERMAAMVAMGFGHLAIPRAEFGIRSYGPGAREALPPRIGRSFAPRFLTEDVPFGLVPIERLAQRSGLRTPVISALITLCCVLESRDWRQEQEANDGK
ncbi:MAG: NAD/NADP octopine/nopaline dehydrogenase family protein [Paracoccus sp. (in: a-proteobacteria)]|uniref:NAD/NADP octopine/nopaline dehydrogenase family protein n=1 Tax=Paracoccus sp. TaxID=267 RepID=UPI0039E50FFA